MENARPVQNILVYPADAFRVSEGVNLGDAISVFDDLVPDDIYTLAPDARRVRLAVHMTGDDADGGLEIAPGSETGATAAVGLPLFGAGAMTRGWGWSGC